MSIATTALQRVYVTAEKPVKMQHHVSREPLVWLGVFSLLDLQRAASDRERG
jgi:hypothetical protein